MPVLVASEKGVRYQKCKAPEGPFRLLVPDPFFRSRELNPPVPGITTYLESCPPGPYDYVKGRMGEMCSTTLHFWSYHPGGANSALCDGSIRLIPYTANDILPALATRAGNEVVRSLDDL
jgi:prepilin-type processing-associated H-X9-DG protein